jgi:hypothetical protein
MTEASIEVMMSEPWRYATCRGTMDRFGIDGIWGLNTAGADLFVRDNEQRLKWSRKSSSSMDYGHIFVRGSKDD